MRGCSWVGHGSCSAGVRERTSPASSYADPAGDHPVAAGGGAARPGTATRPSRRGSAPDPLARDAGDVDLPDPLLAHDDAHPRAAGRPVDQPQPVGEVPRRRQQAVAPLTVSSTVALRVVGRTPPGSTCPCPRPPRPGWSPGSARPRSCRSRALTERPVDLGEGVRGRRRPASPRAERTSTVVDEKPAGSYSAPLSTRMSRDRPGSDSPSAVSRMDRIDWSWRSVQASWTAASSDSCGVSPDASPWSATSARPCWRRRSRTAPRWLRGEVVASTPGRASGPGPAAGSG